MPKDSADKEIKMYLIAGLGNPGREYVGTRHNIGFEAADALCSKFDIKFNKEKFRAVFGSGTIAGEKVIVAKPQTYMNNSGEAIKEAADFYKIPPEKVIVIFDDISLPTGMLRIRLKGSAGGHNGIKSIIWHLNSDNFPRLKIGVGNRKDPDSDLKDYVLGKFSKEDVETIKETMKRAVKAVALMVQGDSAGAMNKYNG